MAPKNKTEKSKVDPELDEDLENDDLADLEYDEEAEEDMMFPDEDSREGFDHDDFFNL